MSRLKERIKPFVPASLKRILWRLAPSMAGPDNMYREVGERYYFELYFHYLEPYLREPRSILEVGCQYGRFTIPLARQGHSVTATDLHTEFFDFIKARIPGGAGVEFLLEDVRETARRYREPTFDVILCLELLYFIPEYQEILRGLGNALKPGGTLVASHKTVGYYVRRFLAEQKFEELEEVLRGKHPHFNCQSAAELESLYRELGYNKVEVIGIGLFSGTKNDPAAGEINPDSMSRDERAILKQYELREGFQGMFIDDARYLLVIAHSEN